MSEEAVLARFAGEWDEASHQQVLRLAQWLQRQPLPGQVEVVPALVSLAVYVDAWKVDVISVAAALRERLPLVPYVPLSAPKTVDIPVCYGGDDGPDLAEVAAYHGLAEEAVVHLHSSAHYTVRMIGFAPGFPYLGGMPPRLATPRRATPRVQVPAGSVAIGGSLTGIYPFPSPGGWHVIGRTPLRLFTPTANPPAWLQAGDHVRFVPISADDFASLAGRGD
ncbi:MAG: 5-oxoprolinase subunit PxpB [Alicyclobacillus sp.]|nr:5-oxoprolinase subunit PxpB [Alicyclobacillus sp.]